MKLGGLTCMRQVRNMLSADRTFTLLRYTSPSASRPSKTSSTFELSRIPGVDAEFQRDTPNFRFRSIGACLVVTIERIGDLLVAEQIEMYIAGNGGGKPTGLRGLRVGVI